MLVLLETPAGYALFKVLDEGKLRNVEDLHCEFATSEKANNMVKLKAFSKFDNTSTALNAATSLCNGKLNSGLKKFINKKNCEERSSRFSCRL